MSEPRASEQREMRSTDDETAATAARSSSLDIADEELRAFADLIASALNQNVPVWRSAPAATHVERTTVRWLEELIGYPQGAGGLLTSGGSMANLDALYIAQRTKARGKTSASTTANANDA